MNIIHQLQAAVKPILDNPQASSRYKTCLSCPSFNHPTNQCRECGCFMFAKVLLPGAECPLKKW